MTRFRHKDLLDHRERVRVLAETAVRRQCAIFCHSILVAHAAQSGRFICYEALVVCAGIVGSFAATSLAKSWQAIAIS